MALIKKHHLLPEIMVAHIDATRLQYIQHWSALLGAEKSYSCNAFVVTLNTEEELKLFWEDYRNDIASYFQAELQVEIEIWNIYLFFVVLEPVSRELKYRIQQDKYSSRKIVLCNETHIVEHFYTKGQLDVEQMLQKCLFSVQIDKLSLDSKIEGSVKQLINEIDPQIAKILEDYQPAIRKQKAFYQNYLTHKNIQ